MIVFWRVYSLGKIKNTYICGPNNIGCVAQLNRASDYGSEGFRFES